MKALGVMTSVFFIFYTSEILSAVSDRSGGA